MVSALKDAARGSDLVDVDKRKRLTPYTYGKRVKELKYLLAIAIKRHQPRKELRTELARLHWRWFNQRGGMARVFQQKYLELSADLFNSPSAGYLALIKPKAEGGITSEIPISYKENE